MNVDKVIQEKQDLELLLERQINEIIAAFYERTKFDVAGIYCQMGMTSPLSDQGEHHFVSDVSCHISYKGVRLSVETDSVYQSE